jgi:hypothetical protein
MTASRRDAGFGFGFGLGRFFMKRRGAIRATKTLGRLQPAL